MTHRTIVGRIIVDILIFIAVIHGWWFCALPLALAGMIKYTYFVEFIVAGLMYDSLFGLVPEMGIYSYIGIISSIILFIGIMAIKKILRDR